MEIKAYKYSDTQKTNNVLMIYKENKNKNEKVICSRSDDVPGSCSNRMQFQFNDFQLFLHY